MKISFVLNGAEMQLEAAADRRVVDLFREDLGLTGTKEGCGTGECGACTILVDGQSRLSCLMLASQLTGSRVTTIEGLACSPENLHPVQQSFVEHGAVQCGFCTPGMVITATDFLTRQPNPSRKEIAEAISGNICRCTGYQKIIDAMEAVVPESEFKEKRLLPATPVSHSVPRSPAEDKRPVFMPLSLDELWSLVSRYPEARVFAGGTDLLVWIRNRRIAPPALISLEKITALQGISETADGLLVGAATALATLLEDPLVNGMFPILAKALKTLGSPHIRRMGTIGGNIVTASPAGDTLPPLHVLGAEVELRSAVGIRRLPISVFILGPGRTTLEAGEILTAVFLPRPTEGLIQHFEKVGLRSAMACAVASFAALIDISSDGAIQSARLAWGSVGPTVVRIPAVEAALVGRSLSLDSLESLIPLVREEISPLDDVRASADYRRLVAGNLMLRLLQFAAPPPEASSRDLAKEGSI